MRREGLGVIVNLSSFAARFPGSGAFAIYALTKHLVSPLSESLQDELTSTGVRVVAIEPGFFATEIYDSSKRPTIDPTSLYAAMVTATDDAVADGIAASDVRGGQTAARRPVSRRRKRYTAGKDETVERLLATVE